MRPRPARARPLFLVATVVVVMGLCCTFCALPPRQTIRVPPRVLSLTDDAEVFDQAATARVNSALLDLKARLAIDFAVLIVASTAGVPIEDYTREVYILWGMDEAVRSYSLRGAVLLVVAPEDNKWYVGYSDNLQRDLPRDLGLKLWEQAKGPAEAKLADRIETFVKLLSEQLVQTRGVP